MENSLIHFPDLSQGATEAVMCFCLFWVQGYNPLLMKDCFFEFVLFAQS